MSPDEDGPRGTAAGWVATVLILAAVVAWLVVALRGPR